MSVGLRWMNWGVVMAKKKRTNPRKRPATRKDVDSAKNQATRDGVGTAVEVVFAMLHDKEGWGKKRMTQLYRMVDDISTDVANGKGDLLDMEHDLLKKHGVSFSAGWSMPAPRNKGATLADIRRARTLATSDGVKASMIVLFTALNAMGWGKARLQRLKGYVDFTFEAIKEGYVTAMDLATMLNRECGLELTE